MLNHIVIMGRLTADPVVRRTNSDVAVANWSVAVDRDYKPNGSDERETDFINCVAWRGTAEFVQKYFRKGSMMVVSGRLQVSNWTDTDGAKRRSYDVVADQVYFGEKKRDSSMQPGDSHTSVRTGSEWADNGGGYDNYAPMPDGYDLPDGF